MNDAKKMIIHALEEAERIVPAGKDSLLGIAARAIDPEAHLSKKGIASTLGLHPSLVVSILVAADIAGDTLSRRELGQQLFKTIKLHTHVPELTNSGRLGVARWCLEQLRPIADLLDGAYPIALALVRQCDVKSDKIDSSQLANLVEKAKNLQRSKIVGIRPKGKPKDKLGISKESQIRRRAGQAIWALAQGLKDCCDNDAFLTTIAAEVVGALALQSGQKSAKFCIDLALFFDTLPEEQISRPPSNGS